MLRRPTCKYLRPCTRYCCTKSTMSFTSIPGVHAPVFCRRVQQRPPCTDARSQFTYSLVMCSFLRSESALLQDVLKTPTPIIGKLFGLHALCSDTTRSAASFGVLLNP